MAEIKHHIFRPGVMAARRPLVPRSLGSNPKGGAKIEKGIPFSRDRDRVNVIGRSKFKPVFYLMT